MKTKSSIKNSITAMIANIVSIVVGLVAQAIFIKILGKEYLGINGLFTNIISMLAIVELGIGNAIIYNLYKPLVNKDYKTINSLMLFYRKAYHAIAIIVFIIGVSLIPFLGLFVGKHNLDININIIYLMFIIDIVCSYLLSYKRSILYADQKNYIINIIHMIYFVVLNVIQLIILYITKNYYLYLVIKIIMRVLENIVISLIVNKKYKYLNASKAEKLDKNIVSDIVKKVKALFFHKIGTFVVLGSDNLIISRFLGIGVVGLYSNYYLIIDSVNKLFGQAISALTPSVGHMLVSDSKEKCFSVFKRIRFINFWIASFAGISILIIMEPFIKIWVGESFLLSSITLYVLVFNFYQKMMRNSYNTFKEAAGIYYEDRFVPIIESIINIVVSIIMVKLIGLPGVFIGTIVSGLALWCYSYPKFVYKKLFDRNYFKYFIETFGYILLFVILAIVTYLVSKLLVFNNIYIQLIINVCLSLLIPNIIIIILFSKTEMFKYFVGLFKKLLLRKKSNKEELNEDYKKEDKTIYNSVISDGNSEYRYFNLNEFDNINNYLDDLDRVKMKMRFDNSVIKEIDFSKCSYEVSNIILKESKVYNFEFNNDYFLRKGFYPKQIANNYELMKYILDYDYNYLAYIDPDVMDKEILIDIINYAFTKVYYLKVKNNEIDFDITNKFKNSKMVKHSYFKECYSYIDKMNKKERKSKKKIKN